ncbi:MAG: hypothetical protein ACYC64_08625 [Armatimonadota bacterium]
MSSNPAIENMLSERAVASVPERSGGAEAESEGLATFGGGSGCFATEATARESLV